MRALIVEDTFINQEFLKMILEGWDCVVVESGEDGVEAFTSALEEETPFRRGFHGYHAARYGRIAGS